MTEWLKAFTFTEVKYLFNNSINSKDFKLRISNIKIRNIIEQNKYFK